MNVAVNDVYEFRLFGTIYGQNTLNVRHFFSIGPELPLTIDNEKMADAVALGIAGPLKLVCSQDWEMRGIGVRKVWPTPTAETLHLSGQGDGDVAEGSLPLQCCGLISLRSANAPPRTRGRFYIPAIPETYYSPATGDISNLGETNYETFADVLKADVPVDDDGETAFVLRPCIWSRGTNLAYAITTVLTRRSIATMRSRAKISGADVLVFA